MLPTQEITFNKKDMSPSSVKVMDTDRKVMVKVEFSSFEFNKQFDKESFDEKKNMTLSQMDVATSAKPSDTFAVKTPLELPLGVKLLEEKDISTEDGKRIIMTYGGEKSFTLIQEKSPDCQGFLLRYAERRTGKSRLHHRRLVGCIIVMDI